MAINPSTARRTPPNPWWTAIEQMNLKKVQAMLDAGANPNQKNDQTRDTALDKLIGTTIATRPHAAKLIALLIKAGADPFLRARSGESSAFELAMRTLDSDHLARAMVVNVDWAKVQPRGLAHKALMLAVQHHPHLVVPLLDRGAPRHGEGAHSVLAEALKRGPVDLVEQLLTRGATLSDDQHKQGLDGFTLITLGGARTSETVDDLNRRRLALADLLHRKGWRMPSVVRARVLGQAVKNRCDLPFLQRLVDLGADPNGTTPKGLTALHFAVEGPGGYPYVAPLLAMGLDPCAPTLAGQTPMARLMSKAARADKARPVLAAMETHVLRGTLHELADDAEPGAAGPHRRL